MACEALGYSHVSVEALEEIGNDLMNLSMPKLEQKYCVDAGALRSDYSSFMCGMRQLLAPKRG